MLLFFNSVLAGNGLPTDDVFDFFSFVNIFIVFTLYWVILRLSNPDNGCCHDPKVHCVWECVVRFQCSKNDDFETKGNS